MIASKSQNNPRIRSFICRQGRATAGQKYSMEKNWDNYCLNPEEKYNFAEVFGNDGPVIMEIGFGNGSSLAEMAESNPFINYLGIEVHKPGVGQLMMLLEQKKLTNVKIFHHDAVDILEHKIQDGTLAGVHLFFPDPWQKRRHHKRRIVRPSFVELLLKKLEQGGYFHAATDWEHYAKDMLGILSSTNSLINLSQDKGFCKRPSYRPMTKFENRGLRLGHGVWDLVFTKV